MIVSPLFSGDCCLCLVIRRLSDRLFLLLFRRGRRSWSCRRWAKTFPESLCSKKRPLCSCRYCRVKMGFLACRFGSRCLMMSIIRIPVLQSSSFMFGTPSRWTYNIAAMWGLSILRSAMSSAVVRG